TDLHFIAEATKTDIAWGDEITAGDAVHTGMLHRAVTAGSVSLPESTIDITQDASEFENIRAALEGGSQGLTFRFAGPPDFARVFAQVVDVGDYRVFVRPTRVETAPVTDDLVRVKIDGE